MNELNLNSEYRDTSTLAIVVGLFIGILMTASFSYTALILGFSTTGSAVAAILGWGIMKIVFKRGTILENNIIQTVAAAVNTSTAGVIFTVPVLLIRGAEFNFWWILAATVSGAILGVGFIIPLRKQMIDIDRLRFPSGTAVASILRSPAGGMQKSKLLLWGGIIAASTYFIIKFPDLGLPEIIPASFDLNQILGLPAYITNIWSISLLSLGIGFIAGRNGLFVLAGGVLAYWLITPVVVSLNIVPMTLPDTQIAEVIHSDITRPLGIGMLIGGSLMSIVLIIPAIKATIKSFNSSVIGNDSNDELSIKILYKVVAAAFLLFVASSYFSSDISISTAIIISFISTIWLLFASIIVSQATGMTDWTPISGMSLIAVAILMLFLSPNQITTAVLIGAAVSVAIAESADMMQDLKTGHLVGNKPVVQQTIQLIVAGLGPIISLSVMLLIWNAGGIDSVTGEKIPGFGPGTEIEAPQAVALGATIDAVIQGDVPVEKFLAGGIIGALLSFTAIPGLGVIMGIAMYLSMKYILPYGLGSIISIILLKKKGKGWVEDKGLPFAAGLILGEALLTIIFALLTVSGAL
jgi:putative OPT family oligopeptide transporter